MLGIDTIQYRPYCTVCPDLVFLHFEAGKKYPFFIGQPITRHLQKNSLVCAKWASKKRDIFCCCLKMKKYKIGTYGSLFYFAVWRRKHFFYRLKWSVQWHQHQLAFYFLVNFEAGKKIVFDKNWPWTRQDKQKKFLARKNFKLRKWRVC